MKRLYLEIGSIKHLKSGGEMQQVVEYACTNVTTADLILEVKKRLVYSLERLEQAIVNYQKRTANEKQVLIAELDGYLGQLEEMIGEDN